MTNPTTATPITAVTDQMALLGYRATPGILGPISRQEINAGRLVFVDDGADWLAAPTRSMFEFKFDQLFGFSDIRGIWSQDGPRPGGLFITFPKGSATVPVPHSGLGQMYVASSIRDAAFKLSVPVTIKSTSIDSEEPQPYYGNDGSFQVHLAINRGYAVPFEVKIAQALYHRFGLVFTTDDGNLAHPSEALESGRVMYIPYAPPLADIVVVRRISQSTRFEAKVYQLTSSDKPVATPAGQDSRHQLVNIDPNPNFGPHQ